MITNPDPFRVRTATVQDIPALAQLIDLSVRTLQVKDYTAAQMDGALGTVFGVDTQLIHDGTYFVVETAAHHENSLVIGCGGWSQRRTLFGGDHGPVREDVLLDPLHDNAKIRAFFVHPDWARQGVGTLILATCEAAARAAGFLGYEMAATLTGERLFKARGYLPIAHIDVPLGNGETLPVIRMAKRA